MPLGVTPESRIRKSKQTPNLKPLQKIIFIVGPTAAGKSDVAAQLARRLSGEIISLDSMQIYKGMDILTSKPSRSLRKKVRHHLIDIIAPQREYNVSRYRKDALKKIKEIIGRGKMPIFAGGTGLYRSVLLDGLFDLKAASAPVRKQLFKLAEKKGSPFLHKRLLKADPEAAASIHPHDTKRIVRALEVFKVSGKPFSEMKKKREGLSGEFDIRTFGLMRKREELYRLTDERVDRMFEKGLEKEARRLLRARLSRTARFAIGLRELKGFFDGLYDLDEARRLIKRNTRHYVKRQLTWFRKDKRIRWVKVSPGEAVSCVSQRIQHAIPFC